MARPFRELDTVDFFISRARATTRPPVVSVLPGTASDHDDVLLDENNWDVNDRPPSSAAVCSSQDSGDSTSKRRSRRPPLVRKPKTRFLLPTAANRQPPPDRPSTRFSSAFNQYLNDNIHSSGDDGRGREAADGSEDDAASAQSLLTVKSAPAVAASRRTCTTCRLFFPTAESLRAHTCTDQPAATHYPKLSATKDCGRCGALNRIGYFCSLCGHPLSSSAAAAADSASASSSPARRLSRSASTAPRLHVPRTPGRELVQCPHCLRKFSRAAADRHIDICCHVINRPSPVRTRPMSVPAARSRPPSSSSMTRP